MGLMSGRRRQEEAHSRKAHKASAVAERTKEAQAALAVKKPAEKKSNGADKPGTK